MLILKNIQLSAAFVITCYIYYRIAKLYGPNKKKSRCITRVGGKGKTNVGKKINETRLLE
jgi:hypothetical protein